MSEFAQANNTVFGLYMDGEFAERKGTHCPAGTAEGPTADLPLDGTWGFSDPGAGPRQGALPHALASMGVPPEWCHGRVKRGNVLVSVECRNYEDVIRATGILVLMDAQDMSWSVQPRLYRTSTAAS